MICGKIQIDGKGRGGGVIPQYYKDFNLKAGVISHFLIGMHIWEHEYFFEAFVNLNKMRLNWKKNQRKECNKLADNDVAAVLQWHREIVKWQLETNRMKSKEFAIFYLNSIFHVFGGSI